MKRVDLDTGAARVQNGVKTLVALWEDATDEWSDSLAETFHRERIEPVLPVVKDALDAIGRMRTLLLEAQRELED